jgi:hypothetical protein
MGFMKKLLTELKYLDICGNVADSVVFPTPNFLTSPPPLLEIFIYKYNKHDAEHSSQPKNID